MSSVEDFKIRDGFLEEYHGNGPEVIIPDGVKYIGMGVFAKNKSLKKVVFPESIMDIGLLPFFGCDNLECIEIPEGMQLIGKDVFGGGSQANLPDGLIKNIESLIPHMKNDAIIQYVLKENVWQTIPIAVRAKIVLTRQSKALNAAYSFGRNEIDALISEMSKIVAASFDEKAAAVLMTFVLDYVDELSLDSIKEAYSVLFDNKSKSLKKLVLDARFQSRWLFLTSDEKQTTKKISPIEKLVQDNWKITDQTKKLRQIVKEGIKYRDSDEIAPADVAIFVINEYASQLVIPKMVSLYKTGYVKCNISEVADQVADSLDMDEFRQLLETLAYDEKHSKDGYILALGRYGNGAQISHMIAQMKEWETWWKYKATGRANIMIARGALFLSETREAMMALDKVGVLDVYAAMRNTNEDTLRDTVLSEFGFDTEGKKRYPLGENAITTSIGKDLSIVLYDEKAKKYVKSIPKKNTEENLYEAAKTDLADLKKNVKRVLTNRRNKLFDDFLSGKEYPFTDWKKAYIDNPVLRSIAELLVWCQGSQYFTVSGLKAVDYHNQQFEADNSIPVKVAHPFEMPEEVITGWQEYFKNNGLKQPFEQIWEPVANFKDISKDRYAGAQISILKFANMDKHGIEAYGMKSFSESFGFELKDCHLEAEPSVWRIEFGFTDDATYKLGEFRVIKESRWSNHIIYILDKWTLMDRIIKDDISIGTILPSFTLPQILDFINLAAENNAHNSLAVLMEYKNAHFQDIDPLEKFILD